MGNCCIEINKTFSGTFKNDVLTETSPILPEMKAVPKNLEYLVDAEKIKSLLSVIVDDILPKTRLNVVLNKNKVFGAAILNKQLQIVESNVNNEIMSCPLYHAEVYTIVEWSKKVPASERGHIVKQSVFLSTHEPCCMCISSIVWAGFQQIVYLFPYQDTTSQGIPHDVKIMHELWGVPSYRHENKFCSATGILDLISALDTDVSTKEDLLETYERIKDEYYQLSNTYHSEKSSNKDNSLVFN